MAPGDSPPERAEYEVPRAACTSKEFAEPRFACKSYACAIQECMAKYDYQQYRCAKEVEALVRCCQSLPNAAGSLHCQGFTHLIKQQGSGPGG